MMVKNGFSVIISSDLQYEELCAEIYFNKEFVAIITQENGIQHPVIEIYQKKNGEKWIFGFSEFSNVLRDALSTLAKMRKV